jgi:hypothetical protein
MLSVGGMCPTLQASSNPGLFKIVSGCFGLPLGKTQPFYFNYITNYSPSCKSYYKYQILNFGYQVL